MAFINQGHLNLKVFCHDLHPAVSSVSLSIVLSKLLNSLRNWDRERIALLVKWKLHSALRFSMFEERGILTLLPFENAVKLIFRTIVGNY